MESQTQSVAISLSTAVQYAKMVNLADAVYKQSVKENPKDLLAQANPSTKVYQDACNNPDYETLVDNDFLTNYKVLYNVQMNDIIVPGNFDPVYYGFIAQCLNSPYNYVIAIRGTENLLEVVADAFFVPTTFKEFNNNALVPSGFYDLFEKGLIVSLPDVLIPIVPLTLNLVAANPSLPMPDAGKVPTVVAGHSLGATLATYYAAVAAVGLGKGQDLSVYTYASPMTGDSTFADTYNNNVAENYRVYNVPDVIPTVPQYFENKVNIYTHVAGGYKIDSTPYPIIKNGAGCAHQLPVYQYVLERLNGTDNPDIMNFGGGNCHG
jgi:hypothetical protein